MKYLGAVILLLVVMVDTSFADLVVIAEKGNAMPIAPYVKDVVVPNTKAIIASVHQQIGKLEGHPIKEDKLLYPNKSDFRPGKVEKHRLQFKHFASTPVFVIGNDDYSFRWAVQNAAYLKKIFAFGIITNVENAKEVSSVEKETGLTLIPTSLSGLEKIVGTKHYPFLIYQGWVVQ